MDGNSRRWQAPGRRLPRTFSDGDHWYGTAGATPTRYIRDGEDLRDSQKLMALFGYGLLSLVVASLFVISRANVLPAHRVGFFRAHLIQRAPLNETWGQYSPYFPSASYSAPPDGCEVDQVRSVGLFKLLHTELARLFRSILYVFSR